MPLVVTADGALGLEAKTFIRRLAEKIAAIWHKSNSEVLGRWSWASIPARINSAMLLHVCL